MDFSLAENIFPCFWFTSKEIIMKFFWQCRETTFFIFTISFSSRGLLNFAQGGSFPFNYSSYKFYRVERDRKSFFANFTVCCLSIRTWRWKISSLFPLKVLSPLRACKYCFWLEKNSGSPISSIGFPFSYFSLAI